MHLKSNFANFYIYKFFSIATNAENLKSIRPPRVIHNDRIIRPFSYEDAVGYKIFRVKIIYRLFFNKTF